MKSMEEMMAAAQKAAETIQKQMNEMQIKLDAIEVAFNDARDRADRVSEQQMREMQGSMGLPPGFNLPGLG